MSPNPNPNPNETKMSPDLNPNSNPNKLIGSVSQSDVIKFLYENSQKFAKFSMKKIEELSLQNNDLISVSEDAPVVDALQLMIENNITGLPVIDSSGTLTGSFSASDVKGINPNSFYKLETPIKEFNLKEKNIPLTTCGVKSTIIEVLEKMTHQKIHRIFIVDAKNRPVGVVTMTTVIQAICRPSTPYT